MTPVAAALMTIAVAVSTWLAVAAGLEEPQATLYWSQPTVVRDLQLDGPEPVKPEPVKPVAFSPDGATLATASFDHTARLWNAHTGQPIATLKGHTAPVQAVAFSPDGRTLATSGTDGTVRLWIGTA